jgi:hypothetical protein
VPADATLPILCSNVAFIFQESFLRSQGIVTHVFSLDAACNLANSELVCLVAQYFLLLVISAVVASVHTAMDKYAMFATTFSHDFLDKSRSLPLRTKNGNLSL